MMPQLVKGGKYVFGWSRVREDGSIPVPAEAIKEYGLLPGKNAIVFSASKTSGGFIIADKSLLEKTVLGSVLKENPQLKNLEIEEGKTIDFKKRKYCWVKIRENNVIVLDHRALGSFGIKPGDNLLSGRGSYLGLAMIIKGPIVECARIHPEIDTYS